MKQTDGCIYYLTVGLEQLHLLLKHWVNRFKRDFRQIRLSTVDLHREQALHKLDSTQTRSGSESSVLAVSEQ